MRRTKATVHPGNLNINISDEPHIRLCDDTRCKHPQEFLLVIHIGDVQAIWPFA
jgi:hypothetical protein